MFRSSLMGFFDLKSDIYISGTQHLCWEEYVSIMWRLAFKERCAEIVYILSDFVTTCKCLFVDMPLAVSPGQYTWSFLYESLFSQNPHISCPETSFLNWRLFCTMTHTLPMPLLYISWNVGYIFFFINCQMSISTKCGLADSPFLILFEGMWMRQKHARYSLEETNTQVSYEISFDMF